MSSDHELGMPRPISRRDLLHGVAVGAAGLGAGPALAQSVNSVDDRYYPPALTGLRGSHEGSFEEAHALAREGRKDWGTAHQTDGEYDLIVVGGGISGLAAAYFMRRHKPGARILILDNHDDFGGHAKRNEFTVGGRRLIGYGGSQSLESPGAYSDVAKTLLAELSVDLEAFDLAFDQGFYARHGLSTGIYFDQATYGRTAYVPASDLFNAPILNFGTPSGDPAATLRRMPLSDQAHRELLALVSERSDALPNVGFSDVPGFLSGISYDTWLRNHVGVQSEQVHTLLRRLTTGYFGFGTDAAPALASMLFGLPGLNHTGIPLAQWLANQAAGLMVEPYIFHFPDGNATVARLLVRSLIPEVTPARTASDLVQASFDYSLLDRPEHNVRIRLNSTAIHAANAGDRVEVTYRQNNQTHQVRARQAVLACYNAMIPHLCPELPGPQKQALAQLVKTPLVYTNVALTNWRAIKRQQMGFAYTPSAFHSYCVVDFPVSMGGYQFAESPDDPIVLHFSEAMIEPGLAPRDQRRIGRARLLATRFEDIERDVRETLAGILGPAGFDPAREIAAITVNRWPHGYAWSPNPLFDPEFPPGQAPHEIGRRTFGNIAIANSDAGARAYLDEAIDQADRAVSELQSM